MDRKSCNGRILVVLLVVGALVGTIDWNRVAWEADPGHPGSTGPSPTTPSIVPPVVPPAVPSIPPRSSPRAAPLVPFPDYAYESEEVSIPTHAVYNLSESPASTFTDLDDLELYTTGDHVAFTNFTLKNIRAANHTLNVELLNNYLLGSELNRNYTFYQEFRVPVDCYVNDVLVYIQCIVGGGTYRHWNVSIFNATLSPWVGIVPDQPVPGYSKLQDPYDDNDLGLTYAAHWENTSYLDQPRTPLCLNQTLVREGQGVFFIACELPAVPGHLIYMAEDTYGDVTDAGRLYVGSRLRGTHLYMNVLYNAEGYDMSSRVTLAPLQTASGHVRPTDIGMTVDGDPVSDAPVVGRGRYVSSTNRLADITGVVTYRVASTWSTAFPGTLSYQLEWAGTLRHAVAGDARVQRLAVDTTTSTVTWTLETQVDFPDEAIVNSTGLQHDIPADWTVVGVKNASGGVLVPYGNWAFIEDETAGGATRVLHLSNLTAGMWQVECQSPLADLTVWGNDTFLPVNHEVNITDALVFEARVPAGQNGDPAVLESTNETATVSFQPRDGTFRSQDPDSIFVSDDQHWVAQTTETADDVQGTVYFLNVTFDAEDLAVVLPDLLDEVELRLEHARDDTTYDLQAVDDLNATNPYWMIDEDGGNFGDAIDFDYGDPYSVNVTYSATTKEGSPVYFNYTANWHEDVGPENLTAFSLVAINNGTDRPDFAQDFVVYNWTSGAWVNLTDNVWRLKNGLSRDPTQYTAQTHYQWSSEGSGLNVSHFFKDVDVGGVLHHNQLRVRLEVGTSATFSQDFWAPLNFTLLYLNYSIHYPVGEEHYSVSLYNATSAAYDIHFNLTQSETDATDAFTFSGTPAAAEVFDYDHRTLAFKVNLTSPALYPRQHYLDRVQVRLAYRQVHAYEWNQTLVASTTQTPVTSQARSTYDDAPLNNASFTWLLAEATQSPGNFTFLTVWMNGTAVAANTTTILINQIETQLELVAGVVLEGLEYYASPSPYVNDTTRTLTVRLQDRLFSHNLTGATIQAVGWPAGPISFSEPYRLSQDPQDRGLYVVTLDTTGLSANATGLSLTLRATVPNYLASSTTLRVRVLALPTTMDLNDALLQVYENQTVEVGATYYDAFHGQFIPGATVTWRFAHAPSVSGPLNAILSFYNQQLDLQALRLAPGTYNVTISATKTNYQQVERNVTIVVVPKAVTALTLDDSALRDGLVENTRVTLAANLTGALGEPLANKTVVFVFNASGVVEQYRGLTDATGRAEVRYTIPDGTSRLSLYGYYEGEASVRAAVTTRTRGYAILSEEEIRTRRVVTWTVFLAIVGTVALVALLVHRKKNAALQRKWDANAQKLQDSMKIQHLLVIDRRSGTPLFSRSYGSGELDGSLMSGFLQALTSFGSEISVKKGLKQPAPAPGQDTGATGRGVPVLGKGSKDSKGPAKEGYIYEYEDFKILLMDGELVRVGLILDASPTSYIRRQLRAFLTAFETKYGDAVRHFQGNVTEFEQAAPFIEEALGLSLIYPHKVVSSTRKQDLPKLQRAIYETAETLVKERKFFFIASLVEYVIAGRKESKNQILSTIFEMRAQKLLEPVPI